VRGPFDSTHCPLIRFLYYTNVRLTSIYERKRELSKYAYEHVVLAYSLGKMSLGSLR
jgi:hypothetical protein